MRIVTSILLILAMAVALILPIGIGAFMGMSQSEQDDIAGGGSEPTEIGLSLSGTEATIGVDSTKLLKASVENESDAYIYQWDSSDKSVATVMKSETSSLEATVTALKSGTTTISVNIIDKTQFKIVESASCAITVVNTNIVFDKSEVVISLDGGNTATVNAEAPDGEAITWSSEDESIATVVDGVITAHKAGKVYIVAKSGALESRILVKIYNSVISLNKIEIIYVGEKYRISVNGDPGTDTEWTVEDGSIASVDANGNVTGIKAGMTTVTLKSKADDQTASCVLVVKNGSNEIVDLESGKKSVAAKNPGTWYYLCESSIVTVEDIPQYDNGLISFNITGIGTSGANFFYLRYQPDDIGDVTYRTLLYVYAEKEGVHQINGKDTVFKAGLNRIELEYVSSAPGAQNPYQIKLKESGEYYVLPIFEEISRLEKIVLSTEYAKINTADEKTLTIDAVIAGKDNPTFEWTSSNPKVATVSGGVVTAVSEGSTMITVTSGTLKANALIIVEGAEPIMGTALSSGNKSATVAAPGQWFYFADGKTSTHEKPVIDSDGYIHFAISAVDEENKKYAYLRYQPEELLSYKATITIEFAGENGAAVEITGGDVTTAVAAGLTNGSNSIEFTFTANSTNPLQIKLKAAGNFVVKVTLSENTEG